MLRMPSLVSIRQEHQNISVFLALVLVGSGLVALPFSGQANGGPEVVGDLSSVCAATSTQTFEIGTWDHASNNLPASAPNSLFASPGEYSFGSGMSSTISDGVARISGVPSSKESSKFLSFPVTTSVDSRIVLSGLSLSTGATPDGLKASAELYLSGSPEPSQISSSGFGETAVSSSQTQRFDVSSTLLRTNSQYYVRVFLWDSAGASSEVDLNSISIDFRKCLAAAPSEITYTPSDTSIRVEFTAPTITGSSTITNYEYSLDAGSTWQTPNPAVTTSPLTIPNLTTATTYQVQTRAVTPAGGGGVASPTQNVMTTGSPASSATLVRSIGNFGLNQGVEPITMKAAGSGAYTYAQTGTLPAGLAFDTRTGVLSGKPTQAGNFSITVTMSEGGTQVDSVTYTGQVFGYIVLENGKMRFGNGEENSINSAGLFQQPFYKNAQNLYAKLTFSSLPLNMAIGTGLGGTNWSGTNVLEILPNVPRNQIFDYSKFVVSGVAGTASGAKGHGVISVRTPLTVNGKSLEITSTFSLGPNDNFVKVVNDVKNVSDTPIQNMHLWVGTQDDWVGIRGTPGQTIDPDSPIKIKGNLNTVTGAFEPITDKSSSAQALMVKTNLEGVLFYSISPGVNMAFTNYGNFSNVYNLNPVSSDIERSLDASYAAVLPFLSDVAPGESESITWFYAAGAIGDLQTVAQAVAGAASNAPSVSRSGSNVSVSWTAPNPGTGRVVTGYQYRYYSEVDSNNNPIWIESSVLLPSQLSASLSGLSSSTAHNFQVRTITGATGGGEPQTGDWSSTATLAAVPAWNPSSRSLTGPVATPFSSTIETNNATGLSLGAGATVTVTGLPTGVSANVLRASTANQFPAVELSGTPTVAGTYTVTITITDSAGNIVTSDFTFTVTSGSAGSGFSPGPIVTPAPTPVVRPPASRPNNQPRPGPTPVPTPIVAVPLGPVVLLESREPIPNVRFENPTQIPRELVDVLARPFGYTVEQTTGSPVLPKLTPSESLAYENGSPVQIQLVRTDEDNGYLLIGDGWQVALEATDTSGEPLRLDDSGNIILNRDRFVQFSGSGFAPGSIVKVWLFSDPAELSDVIADASGNFVGQAQLPEGIPTGEHTIQLNGLTKDGQLRSVSLGVVVQPDLAVPPVAPAGFDLTGLMNFLWVIAAGVLIWFFIAWRRRKKKEEEEGENPTSSGFEGVPILTSEGFEPSQQFPNDSRRKTGPAAPPNRKRFTFKPKGA